VNDCRLICSQFPNCGGFIVGNKAKSGKCWLRTSVSVEACVQNVGRSIADWDFHLRAMDQPWTSPAPLREFYMYRATAPGSLSTYPLGEINTGNMEGTLWYLMNEVVSNYSRGVRCPRRFGISKLHRFKVRVRSTSALFSSGMNFGVRFAYDQGKCEGRCFLDNMCTGEGDCADQYNKYGFFVGCNKFSDKYPFPVEANAVPDGVWYSLPLAGRCRSGLPTGAPDCTWTYEDAGALTLQDLESIAPGPSNCCEGHCTDFWKHEFDTERMVWRVDAAKQLFHQRFPQWPADLTTPACNFDHTKWYVDDRWHRRDPWSGREKK